MSHTRLRRLGVAGLSALVVAAGVPLVLSAAGPAAAQEAPGACPTPSSSASPSVAPVSPSATPTATTSPTDPSATATATTSPSATATASTDPSATPTASTSPTASPTPCPATPSPTASPSVSPSSSPSPTVVRGGRLGIVARPSVVTPGVSSVVTVTGDAGRTVLLYAYSRPETQYRLVRRGILESDGTIEFRVAPGTNTRLFAAYSGQTGNESAPVVLSVRTALSLTVVRNGSLTYTFQGRVLPRRAGQLVTLYRVDAQRREVQTAQAKTSADGAYAIRRVFTGSGTFPFITRTSANLNNAAGISNGGRARPVAVYAGRAR